MNGIEIEIYPMETEFESGTRYVPVRETDGEKWLHTEWVAESPEQALAAAQLSDRINHAAEWVAAAPLVGVAEVRFTLRRFLPAAEVAAIGAGN